MTDERRNLDRVDRRSSNNHCGDHVNNMERIARLEERENNQDEKFRVIFDKLDDQGELLRCLKIGQDSFIAKMSAFEKSYNERVTLSNDVITEYRQAMIGINNKFNDITTVITEHIKEYRTFDFFRKPIIELYDNAPRFVFKWVSIFIIISLLGLVFLHQLDFTRFLKVFGVIK